MLSSLHDWPQRDGASPRRVACSRQAAVLVAERLSPTARAVTPRTGSRARADRLAAELAVADFADVRTGNVELGRRTLVVLEARRAGDA